MKYVTFTIDCVSSKKVGNVTEIIEGKLEKLNNDKLRNNSFVTPFIVMRGDEVQGVIKHDEYFIRNIRYLREAFYPIMIRIGIGIGNIDNEDSISLHNPWKLNGTAFHYAREAIEYLAGHNLYSKKPMSYVKSDNNELDLILNSQLLLYDALLNKWNENTYEAVYLKEKYGSFRAIKSDKNISYSAYTHRASRGEWSVIEDFEHKTSEILSGLFLP